MPARRKTPEAKGATESEDQLRAWYEDKVRRAAHARIRTGFERGSEEEMVALGVVLLELGEDPNTLLLDAAVTALHARCEPRRSPAGRRPDITKRRQDSFALRMFNVLVEMSRAAAATRDLPEDDRRQAMGFAVGEEVVRQLGTWNEENFGSKERDPDARALLQARTHSGARDWLETHEPIVEALLAGYRPGRRSPAFSDCETAATEMMKLINPSEVGGFSPRDSAAMQRLLRAVAKRSTHDRKRARAVAAVLSPE